MRIKCYKRSLRASFARDAPAINPTKMLPRSINNLRQPTRTVCIQWNPIARDLWPVRLFHEDVTSSAGKAMPIYVVVGGQQRMIAPISRVTVYRHGQSKYSLNSTDNAARNDSLAVISFVQTVYSVASTPTLVIISAGMAIRSASCILTTMRLAAGPGSRVFC